MPTEIGLANFLRMEGRALGLEAATVVTADGEQLVRLPPGASGHFGVTFLGGDRWDGILWIDLDDINQAGPFEVGCDDTATVKRFVRGATRGGLAVEVSQGRRPRALSISFEGERWHLDRSVAARLTGIKEALVVSRESG